MAYSTDIKDYYRRAWGLEDRPKFKYGGSWADWMANFSDQMTFEEYLRMDLKEKKPHILDRKADGGRIGFYKGSFVEGNPVGQQWVVKFASKSTSPGYPDNFIGTQKFATEELMNQAIEDRKLISKKNIEIRDKKNVEMGKAKKSEYTKIIDDFIEKGDYENFKSQMYESQKQHKLPSGQWRKTSGGRVPTHIVKFIRDRLDAGPGTELFEELKEITGKTDTELLEFNKNLAPRGDISIKQRSKSAVESWEESGRLLTDEERKEGQRKYRETRKTKEKVGIKYASEQELKNFRTVNNQKKSLNKYFINNPDAINNTEFGKKIKALMEIRLNDNGEIIRRTVDSKGNPLNDKYYYDKAKKGHIFDIFDINKIEKGQRITKQAINLNIMPGQFNSGFIEGQVNRWFKPGGKFHGDTEKLNKISKYLDNIGVIVDIEGVGRIGGGEKVFYDSKTGKFPHITNTLKLMGAPDELITDINPSTKKQNTSVIDKFFKNAGINLSDNQKIKAQTFLRNALNKGQNIFKFMPNKVVRKGGGAALAVLDYSLFHHLFGVPQTEALIAAGGWLTKNDLLGKQIVATSGTVGIMEEDQPTNIGELVGLPGPYKEDDKVGTERLTEMDEMMKVPEKKEDNITGVDQYILNRYK
jgi:hypothetical protein